MSANRDKIISDRLQAFRQAKVMHDQLAMVLHEALFYILRSPSTAIVNIVGPTGVGKSMLLGRIEAEIIKAKCQEMNDDCNMRPFVSTLAVASGHRAFDFKRLYVSVLEALGDRFARLPAAFGRCTSSSQTHAAEQSKKSLRLGESTAAFRERLERELVWRNTVVWCIDEAHHAVFGGKSGSPKYQLEVFKSIAQRGTTKLCLIGPPELEEQLLSSGQLARRSATVAFTRYHHNDEVDLLQFASVAGKFFELMAFRSTPNVEANLDFIYSGTHGCVGILKDWLERAMAVAMERHDDLDAVDLTLDDLRQTRMPASALQTIHDEIARMERARQLDDSDERCEEIVHGDASRIPVAGRAKPPTKRTSTRKVLPGVRNPVRDKVGNAEVWGA